MLKLCVGFLFGSVFSAVTFLIFLIVFEPVKFDFIFTNFDSELIIKETNFQKALAKRERISINKKMLNAQEICIYPSGNDPNILGFVDKG